MHEKGKQKFVLKFKFSAFFYSWCKALNGQKEQENRNDMMHQETRRHTKAYLKIFQDFYQNFWNSHKWRELQCTFLVSLSQFEGHTFLRLALFCTLQLSIVHRLLVCSGPQVQWCSLSKHFTCPLSRVHGHICTHLSFGFFCLLFFLLCYATGPVLADNQSCHRWK